MKRLLTSLAGAVFLFAGTMLVQSQQVAVLQHLLTNTWTIHNALTASGTLSQTNMLIAAAGGYTSMLMTNPPTGYAPARNLRDTDGDGVCFMVRLGMTNSTLSTSTTNISIPILLSPDNTNWSSVIPPLWLVWMINTNGCNLFVTNVPSTSMCGARYYKLGGFKFGLPTQVLSSTNNLDSTIWLTNVDVSYYYKP